MIDDHEPQVQSGTPMTRVQRGRSGAVRISEPEDRRRAVRRPGGIPGTVDLNSRMAEDTAMKIRVDTPDSDNDPMRLTNTTTTRKAEVSAT